MRHEVAYGIVLMALVGAAAGAQDSLWSRVAVGDPPPPPPPNAFDVGRGRYSVFVCRKSTGGEAKNVGMWTPDRPGCTYVFQRAIQSSPSHFGVLQSGPRFQWEWVPADANTLDEPIIREGGRKFAAGQRPDGQPLFVCAARHLAGLRRVPGKLSPTHVCTVIHQDQIIKLRWDQPPPRGFRPGFEILFKRPPQDSPWLPVAGQMPPRYAFNVRQPGQPPAFVCRAPMEGEAKNVGMWTPDRPGGCTHASQGAVQSSPPPFGVLQSAPRFQWEWVRADANTLAEPIIREGGRKFAAGQRPDGQPLFVCAARLLLGLRVPGKLSPTHVCTVTRQDQIIKLRWDQPPPGGFRPGFEILFKRPPQ